MITIIVLLILAAVSVATLTGENGILTQAGNAKEETIVGQEKEQVEIAYVSAAVNKLGDKVEKDDLQQELNKLAGDGKTIVSNISADGILNVKFVETGHNYNVNNGNVTKAVVDDNGNVVISSTPDEWEYETTTYEGYAVLTKYLGSATEIVIPNYIKDDENNLIPVKQVGKAYDASYGANITGILGDNLINTYYSAFTYNTTVKKISISEGIEIISELGAIENLENISLPDSITRIGNYAFAGCANLKTIELKSNLTYIGRSAFYKCTNLDNITIPKSVTDIGEYAFSYTSSENVKFENGIQLSTISIGMFQSSNLNNIELPNSIKEIKSKAFELTSLTDIIIPNGVETIAKSAFSYCKELAKIYIPNSVTMLEYNGYGVFYNCDPSLLHIYCETESIPSTWKSYFNETSDATYATVSYGITLEQYKNL